MGGHGREELEKVTRARVGALDAKPGLQLRPAGWAISEGPREALPTPPVGVQLERGRQPWGVTWEETDCWELGE